MPKLPNHDELPQALRHFDPDYDPQAAVTDPAKIQVYSLDAQVYFRASTDEWILSLDGTINGTSLSIRHPAPKALSPEDVPSLAHLYPSPPNRDEDLLDLISAIKLHASDLGILDEVEAALTKET